MRFAVMVLLPFLMACESANGINDRNSKYQIREGEALYCGESFSIAIPVSDSLFIEPNTPEDFYLYRWQKGAGLITIYEGNFPESGGIVIQTGRRDWPQVVVVHGSQADARTVRIFQSRPKNCLTPVRMTQD